jgi:hypothetical protein
MRLDPFSPGLRPRECPTFFALDSFVFADLFFDQICDPVEGIRMHHRRDDHVLLDFQNLAHGVSVVVAPGARNVFGTFGPFCAGKFPRSLTPACAKAFPETGARNLFRTLSDTGSIVSVLLTTWWPPPSKFDGQLASHAGYRRQFSDPIDGEIG